MSSASTSSFSSLADLGWDDAWAATLATAVQFLGPADPARLSRVDLGACTVLGAGGSSRATIPPGTTVAVGEWVLVRQSVTPCWCSSRPTAVSPLGASSAT